MLVLAKVIQNLDKWSLLECQEFRRWIRQVLRLRGANKILINPHKITIKVMNQTKMLRLPSFDSFPFELDNWWFSSSESLSDSESAAELSL